jgi:hypothetical protein
MPQQWQRASYFNSGTAEARHRMTELELVSRSNWYELYRRKADGSYWRLDADDKLQQRFLVQIDALETWPTYSSAPLEMALLIERRGGLSAEVCVQQGCPESVLKGSAFCLNHTYERGVRK